MKCIYKKRGSNSNDDVTVSLSKLEISDVCSICPICLCPPENPFVLPCGHAACLQCWAQYWYPEQYAQWAKPVVFKLFGATSVACATGILGRFLMVPTYKKPECVFRCNPYRVNGWFFRFLGDLVNPAKTLTRHARFRATLELAQGGDCGAMFKVGKMFRGERGTVFDGRAAYLWTARAAFALRAKGVPARHNDARDVLVRGLQVGGFHFDGMQEGKALSYWSGEKYATWPHCVFPGLACAHCGNVDACTCSCVWP